MIKTGHFFSGGGGGILAAEVLGHESVFALELEHREDGFAITVGLMEYISGWSALEILYGNK